MPVAGTIDWLTRGRRCLLFSAGFIPVHCRILVEPKGEAPIERALTLFSEAIVAEGQKGHSIFQKKRRMSHFLFKSGKIEHMSGF